MDDLDEYWKEEMLMMMCQQSYIEVHKNDSFDQLIQERDELIESIRDMEKSIFSDVKIEDECTAPSMEVRYHMKLEYLAAICKFMHERFGDETLL